MAAMATTTMGKWNTTAVMMTTMKTTTTTIGQRR
jgi:hypothetical protein